MAINKAYAQYKENSVFTANPEELTLMLYNGLVRFLLQACKAIDDKDIQKSNDSIIRAQDIIVELQSTLDTKYPVAEGLMDMYGYMNRRLITANIQKNKDIIEEVLTFARDLRDTWMEAMKLAKRPVNLQKQGKQE